MMPRSSGILSHITSLPSEFGIGDLGPGVYNFIDFLSQSKQSIWQILPLGPTDPEFSHSPYMSVSAFAGNPLLISPDLLYQEGLLKKEDLSHPNFSPYTVDFAKVTLIKSKILKKAFLSFKPQDDEHYQSFITNEEWLQDYALFMALKKHTPGKAWYQWDRKLANRDKDALAEAKKLHGEDIDYFLYEQYMFFKQWQDIHIYASKSNIQLFGDIPIYVSLDSADVWANQEIFQLDKNTLLPTHVAGVPPDYFSEEGQKWGNPLYHWNHKDRKISLKLESWWANRFSNVFKLVDIARIDHFRGFESYWSVPEKEETAINGKWHKGPGKKFFTAVFNITGKLNIVAEDLGEITEEVLTLRSDLNFPGMKVLQFAFDGNVENSFLPFNFDHQNYFVYTGTHDNDTTVGWYLSDRIDDSIRSRIRSMANKNLHENTSIQDDFIYLAMASIASASIFPLQDILGFGSDCRMNKPGTTSGNWIWRCSPEFLTPEKSNWLAELTTRFGRYQAAVT